MWCRAWLRSCGVSTMWPAIGQRQGGQGRIRPKVTGPEWGPFGLTFPFDGVLSRFSFH